MRNPASSVFCAHGAGFVVEWDRVEFFMHVDSGLMLLQPPIDPEERVIGRARESFDYDSIGTEEIDEIIAKSSSANRRPDSNRRIGWNGKQRTGVKRISAVTGNNRQGDNKFSALNGAVWSGGSFIYIPKGVKLDKPLQSYFRINNEKSGQFERTLIIVDEGADVHYVEGCTAPTYSKESLHAAVVEIVILKGGKCRYSTVQNWSNNIVNLVTKRAKCFENAQMEWIDGNIGSQVNMKYPACILAGEGAKGTCISIAVASKGQYQDAGARMIHLAPNTTSTIISKSIVRGGGIANYRGKVMHGKSAINCKSHVECDTLILDDISKSDTIPTNVMMNNESFIEHEATVSKINEEQLFYLMSRGIKEKDAVQMIIMGFIEPFSKELPMEYAVELNQLIKMDMNGSVG